MKSVKQTDILTGSIPKQLLLFFLPIWFGTLFQQLYNTADTLIVGNFVGTNALAAVGATGPFVNLLVGLFVGLCSGAGVVIAQSWGAHDPDAVDRQVHTALVLSAAVGALLTVLGLVTAAPMMRLLGTPDEILPDAALYLRIYFLGMIPQMLYNMGTNILRAIGDSKRPLYFLIAASLVNIVLDVVFIAVFGWGVMGAALASLVSRAVACCAVLFLLQKPDCMLRITGLSALRPDGGLIRRILRVGIPAGIENGMFQIGKLSVASLTSTLGTAAIAANAVANTTSTFLNIPANAVSMAVLTVVGQCLGAGEKEQAVWYARRLLLVAYCGAWVMNLSGFFFADRWALSWFNLSPEASAMALEVMMWFNIVSLFFWPSSFTLPNILRSAGDASFTMAVSIVSMWVFRVGFCYLWVLRMGGGLLSIWMGMYLDWVFRSLCFAVRFVRGRWLEKTVI